MIAYNLLTAWYGHNKQHSLLTKVKYLWLLISYEIFTWKPPILLQAI